MYKSDKCLLIGLQIGNIISIMVKHLVSHQQDPRVIQSQRASLKSIKHNGTVQRVVYQLYKITQQMEVFKT